MLDGDVLVLDFFRFFFGLAEQAIEPAGDVNLIRRAAARDTWHALEFLFEPALESLNVDRALTQYRSCQAVLLLQQRCQQMLDVHLLMAVANGFGLRGANRFLGFLRKTVYVHCPSP